jgi:hypothetical protein
MALRLLAFKQIYKILDMENLNKTLNSGRFAKKRQYEGADQDNESNSVSYMKLYFLLCVN